MEVARRRAVRWLVGLALVIALAWAAVRYGPNIPVYLRNLRTQAPVQDLAIASLGDRWLVVAPHPDDETLGCGGLMQEAQAAGARVDVVVVTNGDGYEYEWTRMVVQDVVRGTVREHLSLGRQRQGETLRALARLGLPRDRVVFLGYPDGGVHAMWQPAHWSPAVPYRSPHTRADHNPYADSLTPGGPHSGAQVLADLLSVVRRLQPTAVFTTAPLDVHRDHWGTYGFVRLALAVYGRETGREVRLYGFVIHRHAWPAPQGAHPELPLEPPQAWVGMPGVEWRKLGLTPDEVRLKRLCLRDYRTQNAGRSTELLSFVRRTELFSVTSDEALLAGEPAIRDPVGDLPPDLVRPAEDIASVEVAPGADEWLVTLSLAGASDPALAYAVLWHRPGPDGPRVAEVLWQGGRAGLWSAGGAGPPLHVGVPSQVGRRTLTARVPAREWGNDGFLLEAYSRRGWHYLNHTLTPMVRPEAPSS
jgi:LmbE family N-acetylglucosaminyl deacetylase